MSKWTFRWAEICARPRVCLLNLNVKAEMERDIFGDEAVEDALGPEFETMSAEGISQRAKLLENELRVLKDESNRLTLETNNLKEKIKENKVRGRR